MTTESHEENITIAFADILEAEDEIRKAKEEVELITNLKKITINESENRMRHAWDKIHAAMKETGEFELTLPGSATDYRIYFTTPRESVKADAEAAPDEYVKLERKPKLKEIGEYLKGLRDSGTDFPNWAQFEKGEPNLAWKAVKKSGN